MNQQYPSSFATTGQTVQTSKYFYDDGLDGILTKSEIEQLEQAVSQNVDGLGSRAGLDYFYARFGKPKADAQIAMAKKIMEGKQLAYDKQQHTRPFTNRVMPRGTWCDEHGAIGSMRTIDGHAVGNHSHTSGKIAYNIPAPARGLYNNRMMPRQPAPVRQDIADHYNSRWTVHPGYSRTVINRVKQLDPRANVGRLLPTNQNELPNEL